MTKASALPADQQEAIAELILEEITSEDLWQKKFSGSLDALSAQADEASAEDQRGETRPLEESL